MQTSSGKHVLIRKTTALWLLQEGERISTDRLFHVRHIQPYSSTSSSSANVKPVTVVDDSVNSKPNCTPSSSSSNVAVIVDGGVTADFSRPWLRIGSIALYDNDKLADYHERQLALGNLFNCTTVSFESKVYTAKRFGRHGYGFVQRKHYFTR